MFIQQTQTHAHAQTQRGSEHFKGERVNEGWTARGEGGLKKRGGRTEKMEGGHRGAERVTTDEGWWRKKALWVGDLYPVKAPPYFTPTSSLKIFSELRRTDPLNISNRALRCSAPFAFNMVCPLSHMNTSSVSYDCPPHPPLPPFLKPSPPRGGDIKHNESL